MFRFSVELEFQLIRCSWVRMGDPEHGRPDGCAVVICNGDEGYVVFLQFDEMDAHCLRSFKRMEVGKVCAFFFCSF
jgi:hypothetical protein